MLYRVAGALARDVAHISRTHTLRQLTGRQAPGRKRLSRGQGSKGVDMETSTRNRGFASMAAEKQREIARKGGRAAHEKGKAHEFTTDEARMAGRKGGEKVSVDRNHMAEIGRRGGRSSATRRRSSGAQGQQGGASDDGQAVAEETGSGS